MSRRKAREAALQVLFQTDFREFDVIAELEQVTEEHQELPVESKQYATEIIQGTCSNIAAIDNIITANSTDWKIERMNGVDRNILRMAIYEMKFGNEKIIANVVINEAIEVAKIYGTEDSSRFINGVLGNLVKNPET